MANLIKYKFSDLYEMGSGISTSKEQAGHGYPFASFSTVINNYFLPDTLIDLMDTTEEQRKISSILEGDVLITRTSETPDELAMSCVALKDYPNATFSGFVKRLRPKNKKNVYPKYMAFYLRGPYFRKLINSNTTMTLRASFNEHIFNFMNIYLPPYEVQKQIGDLLYEIEQKININNEINDNLQQLINQIYTQWFESYNFPDSNGFSYKQNGGYMKSVKEFKHKIPDSFDVKPLLNICFWETNSQPPKSNFIYEQKDGYVRFIQNRDYESDSYMTYIPKTRSLSIVNEYDILMDKYGDAGKVRYGISGAFNVALAKIGVHEGFMLEYVRSYLSSEAIYNYLHNSCMASTRASLNEENLKSIYISIPPKNLVLEYEEIVHKYRTKILYNLSENRKLKQMRDNLLPLLINGQVTID